MNRDLARVRHSRLGVGRVVQTRHRGLELLVEFDVGGPARWMRRDKVEFIPDGSERVSSGMQQVQTCDVPSRRVRDHTNASLQISPCPERTMVEAFRVGIVPHRHIDNFTFGRDQEIEELRAWMEDDGALLIVGDYGAGKTHLIDYAFSLALNDGFIVAKAEVDANEAPFNKPKLIYGQLVRSLRYRRHGGQTGDFRSLLNQLSAQSSELDRHRYLGHVVRSARRPSSSRVSEIVWQWIEAHDVDYRSAALPWLPPYGTATSIYTNILTAIESAARKALGLRGLILLFDEAELMDQFSTANQQYRNESFVDSLLLLSESAPELAGEPVLRRANQFAQYERRGVSTNLPYYANDIVPYLYEVPGSTKALFALTLNESIDSPLFADVTQLWIDVLPEQVRREVFHIICQLYESAYDFSISEEKTEEGFRKVEERMRQTTRSFIKSSVEYLDYLRFYEVME